MHEPGHQPGPLSPPAFLTLTRKSWRRIAETIAFGAAGGLLFAWLGLPAGYLSGAMIAVAGASLAGRSLYLPTPLAHITGAAIGMTLGSAISPSMMHGLGAYPISLTVLLLGTAAVVVASTTYLRLVHKWDLLSALLAAIPGAFSQISVLALETRSDSVGVSIAQMLRVIILVALLPVILAFSGYSIGGGGPPPIAMATLPSLALLLVVALLAGYLFFRMNFPGGWLFGAMFGSGLLHGFGVIEGGLPPLIVSMAMIGIGSMAGTRFAGLDLTTFVRYLGAGAGSLVVALVVMTIFFFIDLWIAGVRVQDTAMAFAPGAMDVMMAASLTMHLDPLFVGAHHLSRFLGVSLVMPFMIRKFATKPADVHEEDLPETEI